MSGFKSSQPPARANRALSYLCVIAVGLFAEKRASAAAAAAAEAPHAYTPSELLSKCHLLNVIKERGRDFGSTAQKRFGVLQTIGGFFAQMLSPTSVNGLIFMVFDAGLLVSRLR